MKETTINVPAGITYLSDWAELDNLLPSGQHYILNKQLTGCGATEKFLKDDSFVIIAMPRKHLLFNKFSQHLDDDVFLYRFLDKKQYFSDKPPTAEQLREFDRLLTEYLLNGGKKILTTYDSFPKITFAMNVIGIDPNKFRVVTDEMQQILGDAPLKANIEHQFYLALKEFKEVIYLSATPFLSEYLDMCEQFKDIPMVKLQWPEGMVTKSQINVKKLTGSITKACCEIIGRYKTGDGPAIKQGNEVKQSREAMFFLNDVAAIIDVIRKAGLKADEVNILCAPRRENIKRLEKLSADTKQKFEIGTIPGRNEPNKTFTFCTSTVYIGSDFYSSDAYTYIFANPNVQSLCLDVATDLQQILGRQRSANNPFRNMADLYYHLKKPLTTQEENEAMIRQRREETLRQIENFRTAKYPDSMLKTMETCIQNSGHSDHYCCISEDNNGNKTIVENSLIWVAELRAWDIANKIYSGDFSLFEALRLNSNVTQAIDTDDTNVLKVFDLWHKDSQFKRRAIMFCDIMEQFPEILEKCAFIPKHFHEYYEALGREGMEDLQWRADYIKQALATTPVDKQPHGEIAAMLASELVVDREYTKEHVKGVMKRIYAALSIKGKPSAADCSRYITVKEFSKRVNNKKVAMIRVVSHFRQQVTIFDLITDVKQPKIYDINDILEFIKDGSYLNIKQKVEDVRNAMEKEERDILKRRLPAVIWNGAFEHKHRNGCDIYSSFTALDFDHIKPENMPSLKTRLESEPCVYAYFVTPSGNGLKAIILHDNYAKDNHVDLYNQLLEKFKIDSPDTSTRDLARGNYLSYDPNLWINPAPVPYHYIPLPQNEIPNVIPTQTIVEDITGEPIIVDDESWVSKLFSDISCVCKTDDYIIAVLRSKWTGASITERGRNLTALSYAGILCKAGVNQQKAYGFIRELLPDLPKPEFDRAVENAYKLNVFGSERRRYQRKRQ